MDDDISAAFETWEQRAVRENADRAERLLIEDAAAAEEIRRLLEAGVVGGCDFDHVGARVGRPAWKLRALIQLMRADGRTRLQVYSGGRRSAAGVITALARQYGVNQRMLKKALRYL